MRVIRGSCHCGNIRYELRWPLAGSEIPVRACSCDFCTKHRGTYTSHPDARLDVTVSNDVPVSRYAFATGTAEFFVCCRCGVVPFASSNIDDRLYAVVNVNTFEPDEPLVFAQEVTNFDGESKEERLARRKRNWIPNVSIEVPE
jgi:hypothetical protein